MLTRKQAIKQAVGRSNLTQKELAERSNMSEKTLSRKLNQPELFTLKELGRLNDVLQFTDNEILAIMRGKYDVWF